MRLKRFLALVVSLAMVLTMMPAGLMVSASESVIDMSAATGNITVTSDCTVSGTSVYSLIVNGDATVTLNGLNITAASDSAISIESGNVTLVVDGDVKLTGGDNGAGIYVAETASVTIKDTDAADDKLTAIGNAGVDDESGAAGIGGTWANGNSGAITVDGATVVAEGYGVHGAGIGSGSGKVVGEIKIVNGADVTAQGGYYADGAGTCLQSSYGKTDPEGSAAIGGGGKTASEIAAIIITDSTVVANGGSKAAGIGANFWCSVDAITITGSTVTAQGGSSSAGIGTSRAGDTGVSANIEITNSTVNATGGDYGAGIGAGYNADSLGNGADASALPVTEISITGGTINATGGQGSAAIGGGYKTDNVDINIDGTANVTATAGALVSGKTVVNGGAPSAIGTGANGSGVFKNSPAAEIAETAAITVFAYEGEGAKTAVEGIANDQLAEMANVTVIDVNTVAMIGNTTYDSLAAAVTAAKAGDTIVLYQDVDSMPSINKAITIKGGVAGVEVNGAVAENFPNVDGTVTFENLTFNNRVSTENNSSDQSNMTLAFKNCTFNISENTYAIQGGSTASTPGNDVLGGLVIENCTFNASASSTNYMVYAQCVNTLTVTGSTFNGKDMYKGAIHTGDSTEQATVATISGNTISGVARGVQIGNRVEGSSVAVDGNTFTNVTTAADSKSGAVYVHGNADANVAVSVTDNTATDCTNVMYNDGNVIAEIVATYENNTKDGVAIYIDADGKDTTEAPVAIAKVNGVGYATFDDAITAANALTGDVTVELYGKVEYTATTANLTGSYDTINFVGKTDDAEISITRNGSNGYIAGTANSTPDVNFTDLILSKPTGAFVNDAGFMNQYFTVYRAGDVTYTNCVFPDGACAQGTSEDSDVTYTNCEFANQTSGEYSLWVYANVNVTVTGGKFTGVRGAKMYAEGAAKTGNLIMTNTVFTESVTQKPAIVLTYGESVTLSGNTYPTKGVFELDLDGAPNGTPVTTDTNTITCVNDNGACGVLVDGKIYTTVAQAAKVATSGSTVTLLHDSTETVELAEGVTLDKNGYEAANVTVASSIAGTITSCLVNLSDPAETFISSEITGLKATESVEIKLYSGETQIATTTLKKPEYFNMSTLGVKIIITGESSSWETVWADGMPRADVIPDKVVLYVDGQEMNSANVPMISTDGEAAVDWAEVPGVNPVGPVEVDTYNELVQALAEGKAVKLTADITATGAVDGTDANIDLNGKKLTLTVGGTNFYGDSTVSNGTIDITGCVASGDCIIGIGDYSNTATLTLDNVNVTGDGYSSAYAVLYVYNTSTLNVNGGSIVVSNDNASAGGVIKAHSAANGKINITGTESDPVELTFTDAKIGILDGTVVMDYVDLDITGGANAINQSALTVKNSTLTIKDCDGRALTLNDGNVTIENSTLDFSGATEGEIRFKKGLTLNVDETSNITACDIWTDATGANVNGTAVTGTEAEMATVTVVNGEVTIKMPVKGTLNAAYTSASYIEGVPAIFGEATGVVGTESFVVELYSGETLVGTATLVDNDKVLLNGVSKSITWHAALTDDGDGWWKTEWTNDALNIKNIPDKAKLFVDGVEVSECDIQLNLSDSKNPIFAAVTDDKGNIQSFVAGTGFLNGTGANAPVYDDALKTALDAGGNITLLRDVTLTKTIKVSSNEALTLDGNGHSISGNGAVWFESGTYDIKNVVFDNITNTANYGILEFTYATANVTGCTFKGNTGKNCVAVDTNANSDGTSVVTIDGCTFTGNNCSTSVINSAEGSTTVKNSAITGNAAKTAVIYNSANLTVTGNVFSGNSVEDAKNAVILTGPWVKGEYEVSITENAFLDADYKAVYVENWAELGSVSTNNLNGNYWIDGDEPVDGTDYVAVEGANVTLESYYTKYEEGTLSGFVKIATGSNSPAYTKEEDGFVRVWGEGGGNASESFVLKLYSDETLVATTQLNNVGGIIDGDVYVTWNFYYPESNDEYWTTTWEEGHPNSAAQPTKVELWIDGTMVCETVAKMSGADNLNPVKWEELGGVEYIVTGLKGAGTEEDPYLINNLDELKWFRDSVNTYTSDGSNQYKGKYVKLNANIDLDEDGDGLGENWTPIGTNSVGDHMAFLGTFDGGNHTISNLYINADGDHLGFFARVGSYGEGVTPTVKNITFNNVDVSTNGTDHWTTGHGDYVGGVIANAGGNSVVENVKVTGDVYVVGCGYVGGIVGHGYPDLTNCHVDANDGSYLNAYYWCAGGIIGYAGEGGTPITNCSVEGLDIWSDYGAAAAVAGLLQDNNTLTNVSAENVEITSNSDYCMGYIAGNGEASTLTNVTAYKVTVTANGKEITSTDAVAEVDGVIYFDLQSAIDAAEDGENSKNIVIDLLRDASFDITAWQTLAIGGDDTETFTINGNGHTLTFNQLNSDWNNVATTNDAKLILNDMTIANSGYNNGPWNRYDINFACDVELNNVKSVKALAFKADATLNDVTVDETGDNYAIWVQANGQTVNIDGLTVTSAGRGIKIDDQYVDAKEVTLNIENASFDTVKKAAILVKSAAGATITAGENIDIADVTADNVNLVWVDEAAANTYDLVEVTGATKWLENGVVVAKIGNAVYFDLQSAIDAVEDGDTVTLMRDVTVTTPAYGQNALNYAKAVNCTIDLNGHTVSADTGNSVFRFNISEVIADNNIVVTIKNGTVVSGDNTWCAIMATGYDHIERMVLNLEDLTVKNSKAGDFAVKAWGYSVINATNVDVESTNGAGGFYAVGGEMVLDNCTVAQKGLHTAPYQSMAFGVSTNGKMVINSGDYSATPTAAAEGNNQGSSHGSWVGGVMNTGGTLIINGGTFANGNYGDDSLATAARGLLIADAYANLEINGGTFNALKGIVDYQNNLGNAAGNPVVTIKGGTYSADPESDWVKVAEGYVVEENEDGTYGVVIKKVPSATIAHGLQTIVNSEGRESVTFTLEDVYAESELKIELWSNDTKISTTTYNNGGVESSELTVNIVVARGESGSWTTKWQIAPSVAYIPDQIVVYGDGEKVAEMIAPEGESVFYERYDSQLALYKALSGVYKAASVSDADGKVVDYYATLAEAIKAAEDGDTVTMLTDVTGDVSVNKAGVTLDGNDKTITGKLSVTADGATVKNATVTNSENAGYISAKDVLIENCTVTGSNGFRSCYTSGTVTFKDSTITGSTYGIHFDGSAGGNIVIDNCTITGWTSFASTIESVKIKDTKFADGNYDQLRFYQDVTLENVTFNPEMTIDFGKEGVTADFTDCSVTDGSALTEVIYLADIAEMGIEVTVDGEPIVVEASVTAGEDTAYYLTLEEALVAAVDGDVVTLLSDVELDESAVLNAEGTIVIDGNGKTVTQAEGYKDTQNGLLMLGGTTYGDAEAATHNYTIKNVVFDDIADWSVIRSQGVTLTVDGCTIQNAAQTNGQSLLRLDYTEATVKHTTFKNNNALMAITHNFNGNTSETKLLVEECVLEDNTFNKTAGIYYVIGGGATITKSEFVNNTVNCNNNGAVIYLGFQENCVVTDNLFKNNAVTDASTSTRVAGAIFFGYDAEITGNVFDNNTATNANGDVLGQVCTSVYYTDIDLSGNYFDGHEPVAGVDYTVQHQTSGNAWTVENYYTTYELDSDGNVVLDGLTEVVDPVASITVDGVTTEYATLTDAIAAADNGDVIEVLVADTYKLPSVSNKTFTIKGAAQDVVIDHKATVGMSGSDITFDSVTIECNTQMNYIGFHHAAAERYVNCVINGEMWTYGTEAVFTNCTFNQTSSGAYNLWTYGSSEVTLTGCTLNSAGKSVLLYNEGTVTATDLTVIDTEFVASTSVTGKAAIEIDTSLMSGVSNVTIDDATTATGFATGSISGNTLWNDKQDKTNINVYVDDEQVWPKNYVAQIGEDKYESLAEAIAAAEAGQTVTVIADITDEAVTVTKSVTITGDVTLTNVSITGSGTDVELTVSDLKFTGNSWINSNNIKKLTVSGVEANVTPSNSSATNSRSAFIALGRVEQNELELVIKNSAFNVTGGGDPVLGWAAITEATITGNTFGSADAYITNADAIKFMAIAANAVFNITGNTVYSNYNGFVFGQNTTRDNAYTVNVEDNDFYGSADHIWVEVSGSTTTHATIKATSDNTVNGNAFTAADIKTNVANWTSYAAVGAVLDSEGKLIGGTYTAKTSKDLVAEGYEAVDNEDGTWTVVEVPELPTATVTEIANDELTFALNFKADEATEEQLAYYGDWYADFVLTVNKDVTFNANGTADGYLSGQYDAWSENWVNVPFEDVTLEAGESIKILEYAKTLIPAWEDMEFTYDVVYNYVKDFNCGVFFTEEFLKANPDFVVTLELRMYNPDDVTESYVIGKTYEFEAPEIKDVAQVVDAEGNVVDTYTTLQKAIDAIVNGETEDNYTIELLSNVKENVVTDEESFTRVIITNGDKNYTLSGTLTLNGYAIVTIEADAKGDLTVNNELVRSEIKGADRHGYSTLPSGVGMINGAQIRYGSGVNDETGDVNSENGIRFIAKVGRTDTLVAFADMVKVEGGEIENIGIEIGATDSDVVVDIKASKYQNAAETIFTAALTNLSVTNYNRMFNAKAYVVVDGVKYVGDTTASRSIYQVSAGLLKKGADKVEGSDYTMNDALEEVLQAYVNHVGIRLTYDFENDSVTVRDNTASGAYTGDIFFAVESTKLDENNCVQITVKPYTTATEGDNKFNNPVVISEKLWKDYIRINNNNAVIKTLVEFVSHNTETGEFVFNFYPYGRPNAGTETVTE